MIALASVTLFCPNALSGQKTNGHSDVGCQEQTKGE
jgi:hypothetical protein